MQRLIRPLASLRLTVVLMTLAMVLIFVGTLAQTRQGVWAVVEGYFRSPVAFIDAGLFLPAGVAERLPAIPFPGGTLIVGLMVLNLLAAHLRRWRTWRRKPGLLVLHAGFILLLVGDVATGVLADEGLMSIDEGGSAAFVEDVRACELSVIDPSDPDTDRVVTVPAALLERAARTGAKVADARLPFSVSVDRWLPHAQLVVADDAGQTAPATDGVGRGAAPRALPPVRGVDGAQSEMPAAYVTLRDGDKTLGTWLVSASLNRPQRVAVGGQDYGLSLRFRRTYTPFTLHLIDFRHDTFVGTDIARNFSSRVRLVDPGRGTDREVLIWMNHPLRYAGRTFYQSSYKPDGSGTVLQVVRNPGWLMPYVSCALVGGGMTWHFVQSLLAFLRREPRRRPGAGRTRRAAGAPRGRGGLTGIAAAAGLLIALGGLLRPATSDEPGVRGFAALPVTAQGRVKPVDSVARNLLMVAGGRQSVRGPGGTVDATTFLLDLVARPERVEDLPIIRVDHPGVLALLDRTPDDAGRLGLSAIRPHWEAVIEQAGLAHGVAGAERDAFQHAVLALHDRVNRVLAHAQLRTPLAVPPLDDGETWRPFHEALMDTDPTAVPHPGVAYWTAMMTARSTNDAAGFVRAVDGYAALLQRDLPDATRRAGLEVLFNRAAPFYGATVVYVLAMLAGFAALLLRNGSRGRRDRAAERSRLVAVGLMWGALLVHTAAIVARVYLQDRPPVTNLYSSAVFVGWAAVLTGLLMERIFPLGLAALGSAAVGFCTLVVAHNLGNDGDTMQMMQAVLDSNFWLATHVVAITLGYSATFLAGTLGAVSLIGGALTTRMTRERRVALNKMVYGTVCFALLLSFVGTVLGGIWADQSWGRFWGWDPKENGAALVVLANAIVIHARWGGLVRGCGIAVLAVGGNIVTAWSWFGTNLLGVGLHAYGFTDSAAMWLILFVLSQAAVMALGMRRPRKAERTPGGAQI